MKLIIIAAVVCIASAAKLDSLTGRARFAVIRDDRQAPVGANYRTAFETENGIQVEEEGTTGSVGQTVVRGSYSYTAPDGQIITINYVADENGYRAEGPSVPAMPAHALEQVRFAEQQRARRN